MNDKTIEKKLATERARMAGFRYEVSDGKTGKTRFTKRIPKREKWSALTVWDIIENREA